LSETLASRRDVAPQNVAVTVIAQDPSVKVDGRILRATVRIPAENLELETRRATQIVERGTDA
jgi:hypothetical protein